MPLANSNGPRWIRQQNVAVERRLRGIEPIRVFVARLFGRAPAPPVTTAAGAQEAER